MSESESKKLSELRVVDLRAELEKRSLDKNGVKKDLVERLQKALQSEGLDPETYNFEIGDKRPTKRLSTSSSSFQGDEKAEGEAESANSCDKEIIELDSKDEEQEKPKEVPVIEDLTQNEDSNRIEPEPITINLTMDDDKNKNAEVQVVEEGSVEGSGSPKKKNDETTPNENVQVEESKESTATPQQAFKKTQDTGDTTSHSNGTEESPQKRVQTNPRILWITNVPKNTRANELKQLLSPCGKVVCAKVVVNARYPGSCCFGYVTMGSAEDATNVITKLNNTEFNGQIIKIDKFENIKADNLNPARKNKTNEDNKKSQISEKNKEDKTKKIPGDNEQSDRKNDKEKTESRASPERRKSITSDRSSRGRRRTPSRERQRERPVHRSSSRGFRPSVLTFDKIKEERERQRMRDRERALREDSRRRHEEAQRLREMREISRRQKNEADRLEREREKLRIERDRIEREKSELLKLERERQRIEREKLEMEKMELQRSRMRLEEDRRAVKRPTPYGRDGNFDDRKRPTNERHFEEEPRFEPPLPNQIPPKKFLSSKDFKRMPFDKHEPFSEKRGRDYNSDRSPMNRSNPINRSYDNVRGRDSREAPSRDIQPNIQMRSKEPRYNERDRSPDFRQMPDSRDRHGPNQSKSDREHHYSEQNADRWNHTSTPQTKFGSGNQKPWSSNKGGWRQDPPSVDRWNPGSARSSMNQQFSGNSNMQPVCPPPPGINNYSERFDYNKSGGIRKY